MTYFGETGKESHKILEYFAKNGAPCPPDANPAEHIIEVVQGSATDKTDWVDVWNKSEERENALAQLDALNASSKAAVDYVEDTSDYATSHWFQFMEVSKRLSVHIWRSPVCCHKIILQERTRTNLSIGLHVEQDHSSHFRRAFQRLHLLENWRWHLRPSAQAFCHFQFHLCCPWLY